MCMHACTCVCVACAHTSPATSIDSTPTHTANNAHTHTSYIHTTTSSSNTHAHALPSVPSTSWRQGAISCSMASRMAGCSFTAYCVCVVGVYGRASVQTQTPDSSVPPPLLAMKRHPRTTHANALLTCTKVLSVSRHWHAARAMSSFSPDIACVVLSEGVECV